MTTTASTRPVVVAVGQIVHLATCRHVDRSRFAAAVIDFENSGDLAREIATTDLTNCRSCKPVSRLAWWEHAHR
jgi:hypothetical protein